MAAALTRLTPLMGPNGDALGGEMASGWVDARSLAANTNENHTVPTGAKYVRLSGDGVFYANLGAAAAVASDVTDGSASFMIITSRLIGLGGATAIGLIAGANRLVTLEFYK